MSALSKKSFTLALFVCFWAGVAVGYLLANSGGQRDPDLGTFLAWSSGRYAPNPRNGTARGALQSLERLQRRYGDGILTLIEPEIVNALKENASPVDREALSLLLKDEYTWYEHVPPAPEIRLLTLSNYVAVKENWEAARDLGISPEEVFISRSLGATDGDRFVASFAETLYEGGNRHVLVLLALVKCSSESGNMARAFELLNELQTAMEHDPGWEPAELPIYKAFILLSRSDVGGATGAVDELRALHKSPRPRCWCQ